MPPSRGADRGASRAVCPGRQGLRHRRLPGGRGRPGRRGGDTAPALQARAEALRRAPVQAAAPRRERLREDQEVARAGDALLQEGQVLRGRRPGPLSCTLATHLVTTHPRAFCAAHRLCVVRVPVARGCRPSFPKVRRVVPGCGSGVFYRWRRLGSRASHQSLLLIRRDSRS